MMKKTYDEKKNIWKKKTYVEEKNMWKKTSGKKTYRKKQTEKEKICKKTSIKTKGF
jgi:hypothetical protein